MSEEEIPHSEIIKNIGIIYCESSAYSGEREIERLADEEILEVATAVKAGLEHYGYQVDLAPLDPENIGSLSRFDHIFNLVETIFGFPLTEYEVARELEQAGIAFTGSSAETLKTCLNKAATKDILVTHKINTPRYEVIEPGEEILTAIPYPVIVKPVHEDGCVGISVNSRVTNPEQLKQQVKGIHLVYDQAALVEEFIDGRDITASILGNGAEARLLPLTEIVYTDSNGPCHLTFDANWVAGSDEYQDSRSKVIGQLDEPLLKKISDSALAAYRAMGCLDYARIDFRVRGETPYLLEVNPNPCINPDGAGYVRSAQAGGFTYPQLVKTILELSIERLHAVVQKENLKEKVLVI
jgi:D-alanine-D-alanine ligase